MDKSKRYAVAGGYISNGAFIPHAHGDMARAGAAKRLTDPAPAFGQKRQTKGSLHPYAHGQAVDDEVSDKLHAGKQVPAHPGMASHTSRGAEANGFDTLRKATDPQCFDHADDKWHALPSAMKR